MTRIDLTERVATPVPVAPARELGRLFPREFRVAPQWGNAASVTPLGVVGEVEAGGVRFVVSPKLPPGCLARLIEPTRTAAGAGETSPGLPDMLATKLCDLMGAHTPTRGYAEVAGRSASVRGRIDFAELARDGRPFGPLPVVADEFTPDRPRNRAILAATDRLLLTPLPALIRQQLRAARLRYVGVTSQTPTEIEWAKLLADSMPDSDLLAWAWLILTGVRAGGVGYLLRLETLFEQHVRDLLRSMVPEGTRVSNPRLTLTPTRGPPLDFRADCLVSSSTGPCSVWDAKWKSLKRSGPNPADVHQVLAYARLTGVSACGLVYPGVHPAEVRYRLPDGGTLWVVRLGLQSGGAPAALRSLLGAG